MVKVLFDHNMPPVLARTLHALVSIDGHEAHALRDRFGVKTTDIDLFTALDREWIVLSKDVAQARRAPERAAILKSHVIAFYLAPSVQAMPINEQAATIIWHWPRIVMQRQNNANGLYLLPVNKGSQFRLL